MSEEIIICPKCGQESGDAWAQCDGSCPMPMSPHFSNLAEDARINATVNRALSATVRKLMVENNELRRVEPVHPHVPASFINSLREEGSKEECLEFLQKYWNEVCALHARIRELEKLTAPGPTTEYGDYL